MGEVIQCDDCGIIVKNRDVATRVLINCQSPIRPYRYVYWLCPKCALKAIDFFNKKEKSK